MPCPALQYPTRPVPTLRGKGRRRCSLTLSISHSLFFSHFLSLSLCLTVSLFSLSLSHTHYLSLILSLARSLIAGWGDESVLLRHERALPGGGSKVSELFMSVFKAHRPLYHSSLGLSPSEPLHIYMKHLILN